MNRWLQRSKEPWQLGQMPRTARVRFAGGVFRVLSRFAHDDWWLDRSGAREAYLELLGNAAARGDAEVLACRES